MIINAKELRKNLNKYLNLAALGHSIEISMRGKPVAQLTAIEAKPEVEGDALFGLWADRNGFDVGDEVYNMRKEREF